MLATIRRAARPPTVTRPQPPHGPGALATMVGETGERLVIDLADHAPRRFDGSDPALTRLSAEAAAAVPVMTGAAPAALGR